MTWRLSQAAEEDLIGIWLHGADRHGPAQADRYQDGLEATFGLLAQFPELARERPELTPPLRVHPFGSHMILYLVRPDGSIFVVRVRHAREDWASEPL